MNIKFTKRGFTSEAAIIIYLMICKILFHFALPEYGYFRDEMYYVSIGDQFSFSNLDMLPLSPLYLKLFTLIFGYSIKVIHLASSVLGAVSLLLTCLITKELGGRKYAVLLTGIFMLFSGFVIFGSLFTYDSIDFLVIVAVLYLLVKIFNTENQRIWIYAGIVLGLGLMNKLTIVFFGLAIFVSLWFVPQRKMFKRKYIWLAGIIALLFLTPYLIWQSENDWYFLDFASSYAGGISYLASFPEFVWNQILPNNIAALPIWLTGLYLLVFSSKWNKYRFFGIMYLFLFLLFYKIGAKLYFLIPMYSILLSVGAVKLEEKFYNSVKTKIAIPVAYILLSLPFLPMLVPLLPLNHFITYAKALGVDAGIRYENLSLNQLPQHFADRFGWEEMVDQVAEVYDSVAARGDADVGILTNNYGQAGAIHVLGKKHHLPDAICMEGWFYFETLREQAFNKQYVTIGLSRNDLGQLFREVIPCGVYTNRYCMPYENNKSLFLCRQARYDLANFWRIAKHPDPEFLAVLQDSGVSAAIAYYRRMKQDNPSLPLFTERQMNGLGYRYLFAGNVKEAIALFRLNVEVYPDAWNVYDSLGEALAKDGQVELALVNYRKSLELNPDNANGRERLRQLEQERGEAR